MREIEFKMEIKYPQIVKGAKVRVEEGYLKGGLVVYYTIVPAIAMSGNFKRQEALHDLNGTVTDVREDTSSNAFYVTVGFEG